MNHGSLFSGIGGFDLAAEWMGWSNLFHCEWNPFGQKVLNYYWPKATTYHDITKSDFSLWRGKIDILTGGFPCQPYSQAGKRLGKEDERHLWPEMLRAIREIQPRYVVGENVRGLTNWNGGLVFDEVQADLESQGYQVLPFLLPACAVNAPHRRDRIWFVAFNPKFLADGRHNAGEGGGVGVEMVGDFVDTTRRNQGSNDAKSSGFDAVHSDNSGLQTQRTELKTARVEQHGELGGTTPDTGGFGCNNRSDNREKRYVQTNERTSEESQSERDGREFGIGEVSSVNAWTSSDAPSKSGEWLRPEQREHSEQEQGQPGGDGSGLGGIGNYSDANHERLERGTIIRSVGGSRQEREQQSSGFFRTDWKKFPTQSPICNGDDGLSARLDAITFSKWRAESIKAGGNAIVPQVALQIFKAIQQYELNH